LKAIANHALGCCIDLLVLAAERAAAKPVRERGDLLHRLSVREYMALPTISLYIVDDRMFLTPYLFNRHCKDVPTYEIAGERTALFVEYRSHLEKILRDELTTSPIPSEFYTRLIEDPTGTVCRYRDAKKLLNDRLKVQAPAIMEDFARIEEFAMRIVLEG
jgi:hypothetical protein